MTELLSVLRFAGTLLVVLLLFNFIILVHEWGHFLAARWRGLHVDKFQIWMGNPIWKRTWNGVQYGLGWLPIGGFVSLPQMAPMSAIEGKTDGSAPLPVKSPLDKIIVAFAGPLFSALLALFFAVLVSFFGNPKHVSERTTVIGSINPEMAAAKSDLRAGDTILEVDGKKVTSFMGLYGSVGWAVASSENNPIEFLVQRPGESGPRKILVSQEMSSDEDYVKWQAQSAWQKALSRPPVRRVGIGPQLDGSVSRVLEQSPAALAGIQPKDVITHVNGEKVYSVFALETVASQSEGKPVTVKVLRNGQEVETTLTPQKPIQPVKDAKPSTGIEYELSQAFVLDHPNPFQLVYTAAANTVSTLYKLISPKSEIRASHMNGPVGIMDMYFQILQSERALRLVLYFSVIINVSLAIFNLLPLPVLDGGHITLGLIEIIRGKAANIRVLEYLQVGCVLALLCFVAFVTLKDVGKLTQKEVDTEVIFGPAKPEVPVPVSVPTSPP